MTFYFKKRNATGWCELHAHAQHLTDGFTIFFQAKGLACSLLVFKKVYTINQIARKDPTQPKKSICKDEISYLAHLLLNSLSIAYSGYTTTGWKRP